MRNLNQTTLEDVQQAIRLKESLKENEATCGRNEANCQTQAPSNVPCALQPIAWQGTSLTDPPPARQLLRETLYARELLSPEQIERYSRFYDGREQWKEAIAAQRNDQRRPTLTINLLPGLVARMAADSAVRGQPLSEQERADLVIAITMLNMDAQKVYNYLVSASAECCAVCVRHRKVVAAEGPREQ